MRRTVLQLEARARQLEGRELGQAAAQVRGKADTPKYDRDRQGPSAALVSAPKAYNPDADITMDVKPDAVKQKKVLVTATNPLQAMWCSVCSLCTYQPRCWCLA